MPNASGKNDNGQRLVISVGPHIHQGDTVASVMRDVLIALVPSFLVAIYVFGLRALSVTVVSVAACIAAESLVCMLRGIPLKWHDCSAAVTGVLLAFCVPVSIPLWIIAVGAGVSIIVAKEVFGGLGNNPYNPAHIGRAFLLASWPVAMTTWVAVDKIHKTLLLPDGLKTNLWWNPVWDMSALQGKIDGITAATPLATLKEVLGTSNSVAGVEFARKHMFDAIIGNIGGSIGETSAVAIVIGGLYLLWKRHITWHIPLSMLATVFALTFALTKSVTLSIFHLFIGGLMLGAFFMATDMVTTPVTKTGRILFGVGCGILVVCIRHFGAYPEGVCYSILIMNSFTPLLDYITRPAVFGTVKKNG